MSLIRGSSLGPGLLAALVSVSLAGNALAQTPARDGAMAETLFSDAKKLMASGDYANACPKLAESYRLDPGGGTLTALALCHEQLGKTASAWAEFIEVRAAAQQAGRADREKYARQHIATLEPTLSRLTITVDPQTARLPDLVVRRDNVVVGAPAWGVASPVDPGDHVIFAVAPGKLKWSTHVVVNANADTKSVAVPALDDEAPAPAPPVVAASTPIETPSPEATPPQADTVPAVHRSGPQHAVGLVLGAVGLASLGVGSYFGVEALSKRDEANNLCSPSHCTDPTAVQSNNDAKTDAAVADALLGGGLAAVIAGVVVYLAAPSDSADPSAASSDSKEGALRNVRVFPSVGRRGGAMVLQATW